ncbi:hypothetical protein SAMN05660209_03727 [Geodermatophilus africanus]|uniref:Uncharacterized protein n=1 Tax=Geodermatophilus africanus TaxID=1137993 RepID=A0A1H3MQ57_9ACTN|nr:hypothetical protein [Geodermatophilus africanus]SDY78791.1 hypothetical protein SAMN05660209_03727 [Geodermatophilus africanus]
MTGRCASARPVRTIAAASVADRWPWPRSQEPIVFSPSTSARAGHLGLPHSAGDLGGQPVLQHQQRAQPIEQGGAEQRGEVLGGERVECGRQLVHDTSHRIDQVFEF